MARDSRRRKLNENGHLAERCHRRASRSPSALPAALAQAEDSVYVPLFTYRTGPSLAQARRSPMACIDYLTMLNERDGGIGGVPQAHH